MTAAKKIQAFVKVTSDDMIKKGEDFPRRFDIYFTYADEIIFYWNDKIEHGKFTQPCAKYVSNRTEASPLSVFNDAEWKSFYVKYMMDTDKLEIPRCPQFINLIPQQPAAVFYYGAALAMLRRTSPEGLCRGALPLRQPARTRALLFCHLCMPKQSSEV